MASCGIYGLRNKVTDKWYVGKSKNIEKRWTCYRNVVCQGQPKLFQALTEFGFDGFDATILEQCDVLVIGDRETYWIKEKNAVDNGYNMTYNTYGGVITHSKETRDKLSKALRGRPKSEEWKKKASAAGTWAGKVSPEAQARARAKLRGRPRPASVKAQISATKTGTKRKYLPTGSYVMVKPTIGSSTPRL